MKAEVDNIDINKLVNFETTFNNVITKVGDLDVYKLKTVPVYLKKLSDVVDSECVENAKFNTLKTKAKNLEK